MLKWLILTCDATKKIVGAQKHLLKKYVPEFQFDYLDLQSKPVSTWCKNVYDLLEPYDDEYIIFGLDDFLPIDTFDIDAFNRIMTLIKNTNIERYELGWGASRKQGFESKTTEYGTYLKYGKETPYSVSCQFSVWKLSALKKLLKANPKWTPWNFEVKGRMTTAACNYKPIFRYIEESALSGRHPGKVNILGLRAKDVQELIELDLIKKEDTQFGMPKGEVQPFDINKVGIKYQQFYDKD